MTVRTLCLTVLCLLAFACSDDITKTQLTFQIGAAQQLRASVDSLQVTVSSKAGSKTETFGKGELNWPVEIVVLPVAGQNSTDSVTVQVKAFDASGGLLADQSITDAFVPEKLTRVELSLDGSPVNPGPDLDGSTDGSAPDAGPDSNVSEDNCETHAENIKCDDGNPCNGLENCNPSSANADSRGCTPSDSPVSCAEGMTCDSATGDCSSCMSKPDGDGDGADSIACAGKDCNDNDNTVAPGKPEKCNNRDDDCDGTRDGPAADADCKVSAPMGGTASCVGGVCVGACTNPAYQISNGVCAPVPASCPVMNPCAPGACAAGVPTYSCTCPAGFRAGVGSTRCAPIGVPMRTIGFETTCDGKTTPGLFGLSDNKSIAADLYAACGVNSITGGSITGSVQLFQPTGLLSTPVVGITADTALEVKRGTSTVLGTVANSMLSIGFAPPVTELSFDILDIDSPAGLTITLRSGMQTIPGAVTVPAGSKQFTFKYPATPATPIDLISIVYTPMVSTDRLFIDQLAYRVGGCGDKVVEGAETCDDGNTAQCDGCDNACGTSAAGCFGGGACYAAGVVTQDACSVCNLTAKPDASGDIPLSKNPSAPSSCLK